MIAADDKVSASVVLANEGVPHGFEWPSHAHRKGQERQFHGPRRIEPEQCLVTTAARVVIHVAELGHANGRINQQIGADPSRSALCEFQVSPVHRVPRLERHYLAPSKLTEFRTQFRWSPPQLTEIIVDRKLKPFEPPR